MLWCSVMAKAKAQTSPRNVLIQRCALCCGTLEAVKSRIFKDAACKAHGASCVLKGRSRTHMSVAFGDLPSSLVYILSCLFMLLVLHLVIALSVLVQDTRILGGAVAELLTIVSAHLERGQEKGEDDRKIVVALS